MIKFLYFDLGNVLLNFDHRRAARQMAEVSSIAAEKVWEVVFASSLELDYEGGKVDDQGFYETYCRLTGSTPELANLLQAGSDIFDVNYSILPLVTQLVNARYPLGILSNTNRAHWALCQDGRYGILKPFLVHALSFEIKSCKPEPAIYEAAAKLAGAKPQEIFYVDDVPANVAGAVRAGFDAVQYTTTAQLAADLRKRGIACNY